jgi:hypothetical protein
LTTARTQPQIVIARRPAAASACVRVRQGEIMRRFTVPFGFTLVAMWILMVVVMVNSGHHVAHR